MNDDEDIDEEDDDGVNRSERPKYWLESDEFIKYEPKFERKFVESANDSGLFESLLFFNEPLFRLSLLLWW